MKTICLLLTLFLISCGKPKKDGVFKADQIHPRIVVTQIPNQQSNRIKVYCYIAGPSGSLIPAFIINGNFYRGVYSACDGEFNSCMGRGVFIHYFENSTSCLAKKGFEEQFTVCLKDQKPEERSSTEGTLVRVNLTIDDQIDDLWCEKKILKIMIEGNVEV